MAIENIDLNSDIWVKDFNQSSAHDFRVSILSRSKSDPNRPIIIYINSYGGQVDALASMIETLDEVQNPIITVCHGVAMSCGAILFSHGDIRFCGRHSRLMIHEISSGTGGDVHDMHADIQEVKRLNEYFMGLLAKNCGLKGYAEFRKLIKDQDGRERYLSADGAIKFGIADAVGLPKISTSVVCEIGKIPQKNNSKTPVSPKTKTKKSRSESKK